jgi:hypothetical protein
VQQQPREPSPTIPTYPIPLIQLPPVLSFDPNIKHTPNKLRKKRKSTKPKPVISLPFIRSTTNILPTSPLSPYVIVDPEPSTDYIVPSPTLHSPLPPPTPPPTIPLLTPPTPPPESDSSRGRHPPFPVPPISDPPVLDARLRVKRYRDLYVIASPGGRWQSAKVEMWEDNHNPPDQEQDPDDDDDHEEIRDVLDRFADVDDHLDQYHALPTRHSLSIHPDDDSRYPDDDDTAGRTTMYLLENGSGSVDPRLSTYSAPSTHGSILDNDRSQDLRAKFVRRVEALTDRPPVPKLPDSFRF